MDLIVAVDENFAIGYKGDLLARISPDLKRFRAMTLHNTIVTGRNTYLSFPKRPMPDRDTLVITPTENEFPEAKACFTDIDSFLAYSKTVAGDLFVSGGGMIYKSLLPYCKKAYVTKILHSFEADTYFPDLDKLENWKIIDTSEIITTEQYDFQYVLYENQAVMDY